MLTKHIEKIQQKSDSYKKTYSMVVSVFVTFVIASVWALSSLTLNSSQFAKGALSEVKDISPASVIKTETAGVVKNIVDVVNKDEKVSSSNGIIVESGDVEVNLENTVDVEQRVIVPNE